MKVVVASGKGGTGKTLVATQLSRFLEGGGERVSYVDADVETPNGHLLLAPSDISTWPVTVRTPSLKRGQCAGHGACQAACAFHAILSAKGKIIVFDELCHSCGACLLACPDDALTETSRVVGRIQQGLVGRMAFFSGQLNVGEARATPVIDAVMQRVADTRDDWTIVDAPPGVACGAVAAVKGADLVLLVAEPTPFGQHDLALAIEMCRALALDPAVILNRADLGDRGVYRLLERTGVPMVAGIPFDQEIATAYASGELTSASIPALTEALTDIAAYLRSKRGQS